MPEEVQEVSLIHAVLHALSITGSMTWQITWALILGFTLSAMVQALVRKTGGVAMLRMMGGSPDSHDHMDAHASHTH